MRQSITSTKNEIVEVLTAAGARIQGSKVFCPYHPNENTPAGSVYEQDGHWRYRCHSCGVSGDATDLRARLTGGTVTDVIRADKNLYNRSQSTAKAHSGRQTKPAAKPESLEAIRASIKDTVEAQYHYYDVDGELVALIIRYKTEGGKSFLPLIAHGENLFSRGAMPKPRPLYNLPMVINADTVVIVEGEKSCDALTLHGIVATTSSGGSNSAKATDWKPLAGKRVILWRDNDEAGLNYLADVKQQLTGLNCSIYELDPNELDLMQKEDAADYVEQLSAIHGGDDAAIKSEIEKALSRAKPVSEFGELMPFGDAVLPEINLDCLPSDLAWLKEFCLECERILGAPSGVALVLALTIIGTAAADKFRINFRLRSDWFEVLGLYAMPLLPTGARKTELMRLLTEPLKSYEREYNEQHKSIIIENQRRRRILKGRIEKLEKAMIDGKDVDEAALDRLTRELASFVDMYEKAVFSQNVTAENIAHLLERNPTHINFDTEGSLLANLFGRYSAAKGDMKIESILDAYSGAHLRINRVNKPTVDVPNPRLSIALLTQKATFDSMPRMDYLADKGFLARFLYYLPDAEQEIEKFEQPEFNPDVYKRYDCLVKYLFEMPTGDYVLYMSDYAEQLFGDYFEEGSRRMTHDGDLSEIITWAKKMRGNIARIIGILHLAKSRDQHDEIDIETVQAGIAIGEVLAAHAKALFGSISESVDLGIAKRALKWIQRHKLSEFCKGDIIKALRTNKLDKAEMLDEPLKMLTERGYILPIEDSKSGAGRKAERYIVRPETI